MGIIDEEGPDEEGMTRRAPPQRGGFLTRRNLTRRFHPTRRKPTREDNGQGN
jgi:hypothetical protein